MVEQGKGASPISLESRGILMVGKTFLTLAIGACGGWLAAWLGLPSPWLLGTIGAVLLGLCARLPLAMPSFTTSLISLFLGISIASGIDAGLPEHLADWHSSLLLMLLMLVLLLAALFYFYQHRCHWSTNDALLSAIPGNLAVVMIFAAQERLDVRRIALVHSVRLFFLVTVLPLLFPLVDRPTSDTLIPAAAELAALAQVSLAAVTLGWLAKFIRIPAGMLIGALTGSLLVKFGFGVEYQIPGHWFRALLVVLGTATAIRMGGLDLTLLKNTLQGALGGLTLALVISGTFAWLLHYWLGIPLLQSVLAYMPGGIEIMVAIAFSASVDPVFVATHQLLRMLAMCFVLPLLYRFLKQAR